MRTLIVSDLHLGARAGHDVLRQAAPRRALAEAVAEADRLVLLGDVVELRGVPVAHALAQAGPVLEEIGAAATDAPIVLVPGNHDHRLAGEWLERRRLRRRAAPLSTEETWRPGRSDVAARVAAALGKRELTIAYPGTWVTPAIYATHGHYLDCHNSIPALEAVAAAVVARLTGGLPRGRLAPDAYESVLAPLYAFTYEVAQSAAPSKRPRSGGLSMRVWRRVAPSSGRRGPGGLLLARVAIPALVAGLNRAGLGRFEGDLSPATLRRAALSAMSEAVQRLGVDAEHVVFGHTHRAGPLIADDDSDGWIAPDRPRLWNSGSWVYEPPLIGPHGRASGHWPGAAIVVEDDRPPRLERLLDDARTFTAAESND